MKIDLAVWTAVNGYEWQPGHIYSLKELSSYKDEIGPLVPDALPLGGLFLKNGKVVFYRVQIAERMDSRGRGAIYCVLGTVPEDKAKEVDFSEIFKASEVSRPQKPFPTAIDYYEKAQRYKLPLGSAAFAERRFTGVETFSELGGWCEEARGGVLAVRITGDMTSPLFTVGYKPNVKPVGVPPKTELKDESQSNKGTSGISESPVKTGANSFLRGLIVGLPIGIIFGVVITALGAWIVWPSQSEIGNVSSFHANRDDIGLRRVDASSNDTDAMLKPKHLTPQRLVDVKRKEKEQQICGDFGMEDKGNVSYGNARQKHLVIEDDSGNENRQDVDDDSERRLRHATKLNEARRVESASPISEKK